jgi:hypothetical protein
MNNALAPVSIRVVAATLVTFMGNKMHLFAVGAWVARMRPWVNRWTVSSGCRSSDGEARGSMARVSSVWGWSTGTGSSGSCGLLG